MLKGMRCIPFFILNRREIAALPALVWGIAPDKAAQA
jgi:hypothetical protein